MRDVQVSGNGSENILPSSLKVALDCVHHHTHRFLCLFKAENFNDFAPLQVFSVVRWPKHKLAFLSQFLRTHSDSKMIVYFLTCAMVDYFSLILPKLDSFRGIRFFHIHGKMKQKSREKALKAYSGKDTIRTL